jgi:serine/threonine-protein kinase
MPPPHDAPRPSAEARLGHVVSGRFRIQAILGSGGVGVVYRAVDLAQGGDVALKVLSESLEISGQVSNRFRREGAALTKLSHPHIVTVLEHGVSDGLAFIAMELLEGRTLAQHVDEHAPLPLAPSLEIASQVLSALAYAHAAKVVHRDLKPGNVFITGPAEHPHVKLLDFGLVKFLEPDDHDVDQTLTRSGMVMGTPLYMAPEQCTGDADGVGDPRDGPPRSLLPSQIRASAITSWWSSQPRSV